MERKEQTTDLSEMVAAFLKYKSIAYKSLTAINVKQSNIVIGYTNSADQQKWIEYNLAFIFSFVFHQALEKKSDGSIDEVTRLINQVFDLKNQVEEMKGKVNQFIENSLNKIAPGFNSPVKNDLHPDLENHQE